MGREAITTVRIGKNVSRGKVLLETNEIIVRGENRAVFPFREMKSVKAADGELRFKFRGQAVQIELGAQADKWAEKILHPPSLLEKLGVKPGLNVALMSMADTKFDTLLAKARVSIAREQPKNDSDLVFLGAESRADLKRISGAMKSLQPAGALWIVYPKGRKDITENDVLSSGRAAGLKDVKVCSFSPAHTALKFVIPLAQRS